MTTTKKTTTTKKQIITTTTTPTSTEVLKSDNSYLSSLTIDNIKFDFNKEIFEYKIDVLNDVREINIKGVSEDEQASIEGLGMHLLNEGTNIIEIIVEAQDGSQKIYSLYINKKEEETTKVATLTTEKKSKEEQDNKAINYIFIVGVAIVFLVLMGIVITLFRKGRSYH
ncbi:MAG: cadherin-like beta sandwich domain-containing protein [Bacilli bacterium]|nr:cadherin-like beta sandwich domain-containing protein [Bacilli bacterium]